MLCRLYQSVVTILGFLVLLGTMSCSDLNTGNGLDIGDQEYDLAVPLINTKISVKRLSDVSKSNTSIKIAPDGKATVLYNGEVIRRTVSAIFPPFPGLIPYEITDSVSSVVLQFNQPYQLKKATFQDTKIRFFASTDETEDVDVEMRILELSKDGKQFVTNFKLKYQGTSPTNVLTDEILIDGYTLISNSNTLTFSYKAITKSGKRIKFKRAQMSFDVIKFSYLDGYLGFHRFAVDGSVIDVGLFNNWLSGSFDFSDPKITISVDNAFGLPVRSRVNKMDLTSINGKAVSLQSPFVNTGIDFAYPSFSEIGQIKKTNFVFDKNNSNIREVFNEKTKSIAYDIDALVNPDQDTSIRGFIDGSAFFVVNVAVEVPLLGSINQVVIADTLDLDLKDVNEIISAQFKALISNDFPAQVDVQGYFLDENGKNLEQLFDNAGITLRPAALGANDRAIPGIQEVFNITYDEQRFAKIKAAKKIAFVVKINTTGSDTNRALWIYDNYGIGLKLGSIFKYKKQ